MTRLSALSDGSALGPECTMTLTPRNALGMRGVQSSRGSDFDGWCKVRRAAATKELDGDEAVKYYTDE